MSTDNYRRIRNTVNKQFGFVLIAGWMQFLHLSARFVGCCYHLWDDTAAGMTTASAATAPKIGLVEANLLGLSKGKLR